MRLIPDKNQIASLLANYHNLAADPAGITLSADILAETIHPPTFESKTRIATLVALPMFADAGDVIVTADGKIRAALEVVEPAGSVVCHGVEELRRPPPY